jgi:DNA-binding transcriptional regulator PaaX
MSHKENNNFRESLTDLLMATLFSARNTHRFRSILSQRKFNRYKKESVRVALSRLHKKGYVENSNCNWSITKRGEKYIRDNHLFTYISSPFKENTLANMIISFDIPEKDRIKRHWLRNQLKIFSYKILQQSLWIGPGPLPQSFLKRLEDLNIKKNIKTFKITKKK